MIAFRLDLKEGNTINGKFRIEKSIGRGSYGDVFLVKDSHDRYAMKVLRLYDEPSELHTELVTRFEREYKTAQKPGDYFVHSLEYGELKGNFYFTMEYCPKGDLVTYMNGNTTLLPELTRDVLLGLNDLHTSGMIHRDLKPENILVRENGRAALTDFGVVGNKNAKTSLSGRKLWGGPKQRFGTPLYMAPEMNDLKGGGVTYLETIDIFSLGVILYELLTGGKFPFGNPESPSDLPDYFSNAKKGIWSRQRLREVQYGRDWLPIIDRCLQPNYQNRYQSVLEILEDLKPMLGPAPIVEIGPRTRSLSIRRLVVTQGEEAGRIYRLSNLLGNGCRMIRVGRSLQNDIVLKDNIDTFVSRHHFTLEQSIDAKSWVIKDGQWSKEDRRWLPSTNGTYLNATRVSEKGLKIFTGDIITAGEYKLKVE